MSEPVSPIPVEENPEEARAALGKLKKRLLWGAGILIALYFNIYLIPMVFHTLIPFFALGGIGFLFGCALPRKTQAVSWGLFWVVLVATLVRRVQTFNMPLSAEIFGGSLAQGGYPPWAAWVAELIRLRIYLAALRLGTATGARLRTVPAQGEA